MLATFTRPQLAAMLESAGYGDLADQVHATRPPDAAPSTRALALDYDDTADLMLFGVILGRHLAALTPAGRVDLQLAAATVTGLPSHPVGGWRHGAWWPNVAFDEPTVDQWWDAINECAACDAYGDDKDADDELCPTHRVAPWSIT